MTTDEISGKPRVPVGELREKVEDWEKQRTGDYKTDQAFERAADELEALIERYDYE